MFNWSNFRHKRMFVSPDLCSWKFVIWLRFTFTIKSTHKKTASITIKNPEIQHTPKVNVNHLSVNVFFFNVVVGTYSSPVAWTSSRQFLHDFPALPLSSDIFFLLLRSFGICFSPTVGWSYLPTQSLDQSVTRRHDVVRSIAITTTTTATTITIVQGREGIPIRYILNVDWMSFDQASATLCHSTKCTKALTVYNLKRTLL